MILIRFAQKRVVKHRYSYSIVISDHTLLPTTGKVIDKVGFYVPFVDRLSNQYIVVNMDLLSF
jgi:ribosomal protein S16